MRKKRVLINWAGVSCIDCGSREHLIAKEGEIHCSFCGGQNLVDKNGGAFIPTWKLDNRNQGRKWAHVPDRRNYQQGGLYAS